MSLLRKMTYKDKGSYESSPPCMRIMTNLYAIQDSYISVTWLIHLRDMTHPYTWRDSSIYVTWLIHIRDSSIYVTRLMNIRDMTHSSAWNDSFIRVTGLTHKCDMTHTYTWHDLFTCATWLYHMNSALQTKRNTFTIWNPRESLHLRAICNDGPPPPPTQNTAQPKPALNAQ